MALLLPSSLSVFPSSSHSLVSSTHRCFPIASPNLGLFVPRHSLFVTCKSLISPPIQSAQLAIRLPWKSLSNSALLFQRKTQILTRASSEASGEESALPPPEKKEELVSVEDLPLQSKQQQLYELRMKIKTNRILRRRRRRLLRKRRLRKKGKWPLAKMKKKGKRARKAKKKKGKKRKY